MPALFRLDCGHAVQLFEALRPLGGFVGKVRFPRHCPRNTLFERHGRIEGYQLAMINDGNAVAQAIGFVHIVGGNSAW